MTIKVIYTDFKVKLDNEGKRGTGEELSISKRTKELMRRDSSWGTYISDLSAAELTCGQGSIDRWKSIQPDIINHKTDSYLDPEFSLLYPNETFNFESESIDHFVGTVAGDILQYNDIESVKVSNFEFTDSDLYNYFPGPNFGIDRLYNDLLSNTLQGQRRPIIAFTIKPRSGMDIEDYIKLYSAAAKGGIDIIEDDERLVDPVYCPFEERVKSISELMTSFPSIYSVNITGDSDSALKKLSFCADHGIRMVKIDVLVCGFETLRKVAQQIKNHYDSNIAITVYPDAYKIYRCLSRDFILKLSRICGADIIYAGSPLWARYLEEGGRLTHALDPIYSKHVKMAEPITKAPHIGSTLCTITNDQHPSRAEATIAFFRKFKEEHYRYAFFIGGGISGFPLDIENSSKELMNCVKHASSTNINEYKNYDMSKYDQELTTMGWRPLDFVKDLNEGN